MSYLSDIKASLERIERALAELKTCCDALQSGIDTVAVEARKNLAELESICADFSQK